MDPKQYDALIVGSGPNGLSAAITLARAGLKVGVLEAKETIGGGMRTAELTLPGFHHDICSAIHPTGVGSPFFKSVPLDQFGLEWVFPPVACAHPFDDGDAAYLVCSLEETGLSLKEDEQRYQKLIGPFVKKWDLLAPDLLGPVNPLPSAPFTFAKFGLHSLLAANTFAQRFFKGRNARGLFAGLAGHSVIDLKLASSSAIGVVLAILGHKIGWPMPKGGSQQIANAMGAYLKSLGGAIFTNYQVDKWSQLEGCRCVLFDTSPKTMIQVMGDRLPKSYQRQLQRFQPGPGVFKIDLALSEPIPFQNEACQQAGTLHLGSTLEEIVTAEHAMWKGQHPEKPYVLLAQQSRFDATRAPEGQHTAWAYCHVPNGSVEDMQHIILNQIERYAPGFRDTIIGTHVMSTEAYQAYNQNYTGGDINGGANTLKQIFGRPVFSLDPYRTPMQNVYLCSASTPPGGGVHGMGGYHAARSALKRVFGKKIARNPLKES